METKLIKPSRRISRSLQAEVFFRDCWLCRYCKRPVIFAPAMKYLQKELDCANQKGLAYWRYAYFASVFLHFACRYQDDLSESEKDWRKILGTRVCGAAVKPKVDLAGQGH
jgi:hypothetical protein